MQGLTSYDDSDPESPPLNHASVPRKATSSNDLPTTGKPSAPKDDVDERKSKTGPTRSEPRTPQARPSSSVKIPVTPLIPAPQPQASTSTMPSKKPLSIGIKLNRQLSNSPSNAGASGSRQYGRMGTGSKSRFDEPDQDQAGLGSPSRSQDNEAEEDNAEGGLSEDQLFRKMTAPRGWTSQGWAMDLADGNVQAEGSGKGKKREVWEIPELTKELPDAALQNKVDTYLKLKLERDQHINTTLLSSTAFANPHIYSKLVEFVNIDERGTAFPNNGWLTRRGLEERRPTWGPKQLSDLQKKEREAVERTQREGGRKGIDFAPASRSTAPAGKGKERDPRNGTGTADDPFVLPLEHAPRSSVPKRDERERESGRSKRKDRGGGAEDEAKYERERERKRERWKGVS